MKRSFTARGCTKEKYLMAFLLGFGTMLFTLLPMMFTEHGYFIYYGDYNAQQIPFYSLANDAVRSGSLGWNWFTDLGTDFLTSYSFYLSGSPFFWLTVLLPRGLVIYAMPFVLALKHGIASLTAYAYIRRFVRGKNAAVTGALLYSFSGFQVFNIFFNHFQDVTALFPLMLIAMEENINCRRRGVFALTVALCACVNYYFFAGQAVFLILYYLFRMRCRDFHTSWRKFFGLAFEAVTGSLMAAFILLPSAMALMGNYRISERLYGADMTAYTDKTLLPRLVQTLFMPADPPAYPNLFTSEYEKWASIGAYLPLFSMAGVISFMHLRRKHWASKLLFCCGVFALVPILNSLFQAANSYYYARWFYMPILIMAMMTAHTLDDENNSGFTGLKVCAVMTAVFAVIGCFPAKPEEGKKAKLFAMPEDVIYFWVTVGVTVLFLVCAFLIFRRKKRGRLSSIFVVFVTAVASIICVFTTTLYGANSVGYAREYIDSAIEGEDEVWEEVADDKFFRIDISADCDNYPMLWGLPSMRAFQSVVNTSIMDFYSYVGVPRDVASRAKLSHYALRGLLSVKYYYKEKKNGFTYEELLHASPDSSPVSSADPTDENTDIAVIPDELPGFRYVGETDNFEIYENTLYVPMGFAYNTYVTRATADDKSKLQREKLMMKSLILTDEQAERYSDIITEYDPEITVGLSRETYKEFCRKKQSLSAKSFTYDSHGFTSEIDLDSPKLVFFSVPYSSGWTAEVNGSPVDIEKVNEGFMAVRAEKGSSTIVFRYRTPYLREGIIISCISASVLAAYVVIFRRKRSKGDYPDHKHFYDYESCEKIKAAQEYCDSLFNTKSGKEEK
ncbi:YfhO family protein [Ruminococcus sp.]|uniref:YfhO family protein n=1 Tax=Ruminococcus sp. TaxID=41978 RepID=UPI002C76DB5C|nr:YfhO family protein [Ruminococcus sp.]HNZ98368.1 YfhO family protein [Ruminococcus sp.]HOH86747.1 YfhO family protein [Ruminococcus sp.]